MKSFGGGRVGKFEGFEEFEEFEGFEGFEEFESSAFNVPRSALKTGE